MSGARLAGPSVEVLTEFRGTDLGDLCDAAVAALEEDGGFGWLKPPPPHIMEAYWKGVVLVPDRHLCVARLDGTVAGATLLARPPRQNEAQAATAQLSSTFVAPWARHRGLGRRLIRLAEDSARELGTLVLNLDLRETQKTAIRFFEVLGYRRWGIHPAYARVEGRMVAGHFFWKPLTPEAEP